MPLLHIRFELTHPNYYFLEFRHRKKQYDFKLSLGLKFRMGKELDSEDE